MNNFNGRCVRGVTARACLMTVLAVAAASVVPVHTAPAQHVAVERNEMPNRADALARRITVDFDGIPLSRAVDLVAARAGLRIYLLDATEKAGKTPVTLRADSTRVGDILERLLPGTGLHAEALGPDIIAIRPEHHGEASVADGGIAGVVTNSRTKLPLVGATVTLDDSAGTTRTDEHGAFHFMGVKAGARRLTARYVGYSRQTRVVTVINDSVVTTNFALEPGVNTLDQVVVTATGEQRIRELGHTVTVINADSVVKAAPISSVTDLLRGRVPGLTIVSTGGGLAGSPSVLRLRGSSSLNLTSEPIVIVDGVRYRNQNTRHNVGDKDQLDNQAGFYGAAEENPLDHLNVNDIETVEVVKGPSASTLYGPDASDGVIVIKTKRGSRGKTQWNWYIHPLENSVPARQRTVQSGYQVWSHYYNDPTQRYPYTCTLEAQYRYRQCVIDSVTRVQSVYAQPEFSTLGKAKPAFQYGANVAGGTDALSYYFSGDYSNKIGSVQFPAVLRQLVLSQTQAGSAEYMKNPSTLQSVNGHGSVSASPSQKITLSGQVDYHTINQRLASPEVFYGATGRQLALPPGATGVPGDSATDDFIYNNIAGLGAAITTQANQTQHTIIATQADVHPLSWFTAGLSLGLDLNHETTNAVIPAASANQTAQVKDSYRNATGRSVTLNLGIDNDVSLLHFATHSGVNYNYALQNDLSAYGSGIPFGGQGLALASGVSVDPQWAESAELGWYGQEVIGVARQLFVDLGVRMDGTSRAGQSFNPTAQPKFGVSWVASESPLLRGRLPGVSELRFRSSWGSATRYPTEGMVQGWLNVVQVSVGNQQYPGVQRQWLTDPTLGPETSKEFEVGADATLFGRLAVAVTKYSRRTNHQLQLVQFAANLPQSWTNLGDVSQNGFEATATLPMFDNAAARGDLQFAYSHTTSKLLSLGAHQNTPLAQQLFPVGYPVDAVFATKLLGVVDTVGGGPDGIYEDGERVIGSLTYYGVRYPPTTITLTPTFTFFNLIHVSSLFERETGFVAADEFGRNCAAAVTCRAAYDPTTPILTQAKLLGQSYADWLRPGNFMRWRELTISADVPQRFLRIPMLHTGLTRATVSLQGQNLFLWTKNGNDPETYTDLRGSFAGGGIPQSRSWGFRFDITP